MPGDFLKEVENRLTHATVIEAVSRRSLGNDRLPVLGGIAAIGILRANPFRGRVDVNLHNHFQSNFVSQVQEQVEILEVIFALSGFSYVPFDPSPNRIETQTFDL